MRVARKGTFRDGSASSALAPREQLLRTPFRVPVGCFNLDVFVSSRAVRHSADRDIVGSLAFDLNDRRIGKHVDDEAGGDVILEFLSSPPRDAARVRRGFRIDEARERHGGCGSSPRTCRGAATCRCFKLAVKKPMRSMGYLKELEPMAKKPVTLSNGRSWPSRGDAIDFFRTLRDRYPVGGVVTDPSDHDDLLALLRQYDLSRFDGPSKIGVGVDRFETRMNVTNGGKNVGFWVVRVDGSETDFSFIRAVNEAPKRDEEQLTDACRATVYAELQSARIAYFAAHSDQSGRVRCEVSGEPILEEESGFGYVGRGFSELVRDFASSQGWNGAVPEGVLSAPADAQTTTTFVSQAHAAAFRNFHRTSAVIRVVTKAIARQRGREAPQGKASRYLEL